MAENLDDLTKDELLEKAREVDLEGRSEMTKDELVNALSDESGDAPAAPVEDTSGLRHTPGSTTPKTGPAPPPFPTAPANIPESDRRFGIVANRSASRVVSAQDRRDARRARLAEAAE